MKANQTLIPIQEIDSKCFKVETPLMASLQNMMATSGTRCSWCVRINQIMGRKKQSQKESKAKANLVKVAELGEIKPGQRKVVLVNGTEIALFNLDGEFYAINNRCPHAEFSLGHGLVYGDVVICLGHAWMFNIRTGECMTKKSQPVRAYKVVVEDKDIKIQLF
jgi:nitrite reductase/ring-hydroxylating ferredoxin subunit